MSNTRRHRYCHVERSPYFNDLKGFRASLETADYTAQVVRGHLIRLDKTLREIAAAPGSIYRAAQLRTAFGKHNASRGQLAYYRGTQRRFEIYLASRGRLTLPAPDRFAVLRDRYHRELVEVRGFAHSTLCNHGATVADFLSRGLRRRQHLNRLTRDDIDRYVALKSAENSRQSLQHIVAALRAFLRYCYDQGEIASKLDAIDTPRTYRGELLPRAMAWPWSR